MAALLEALVVEHHVGMVKLGEGQRPRLAMVDVDLDANVAPEETIWNPFNLDTNVTRSIY